MRFVGITNLGAIAAAVPSPGARQAPANKRRGSIQGKLLLGFAILTSFGFLATSVASVSFRSLANKLYQIENKSLSPLMELLSISRQTAALSTMLTNIARAETGSELENAMALAVEFRSAAIANLTAIPASREGAGESKLLRSLIEDLSFSVVLLGSATAERISLRSERLSLTAGAIKAHRKIYETLAPMADDANFNLTMALRQNAPDSSAERDKSALRALGETELPILLALADLRAETNLIAGILGEASLATERIQFVPLRDRLVASSYRARMALKELSAYPDQNDLRPAVEDLLALAEDSPIIDVRDRELAADEKAWKLIRDSREKQAKLASAVETAAEHSREAVSQLVSDSNEEIAIGNRLLAVLSVSSIAVLVGAYLFIHWQITLRLSRLRSAIITVADGNHTLAVPVDGNDELADMGAAVETFKANAMKLKELEAERAKNFERANQALKAKSEFLANMSHELRTPMHAILSYAKMGVESVSNIEIVELETYFKNISKAGTRLLGLLNNLLDLAKLESGKMRFNKSLDDFSGVLEQTWLEMDPILKEKSLTIITNNSATNTKLIFDKQRMIQVMINLLANSAKFSSKGGSIDVSISDGKLPNGAEALCCSVADNGTSIPESELETVFDKFIQSTKTKTGAGGTGLGLAICREIVEAHGGKIWAENRKPKGVLLSFLIAKNACQQAS
ncbi:MAG: ATP-binding protein [Rhodomicrobium sp.]